MNGGAQLLAMPFKDASHRGEVLIGIKNNQNFSSESETCEILLNESFLIPFTYF
jgi:hypothetical protein